MKGIASQIKTAQDKDGMLRRALERIIQLYTDKSHFVYELLQNAEDAEAKSIKFIQYEDRLEVLHDGKPFTSENLQRLCDIGRSDKADNLNQIGEFGVGFKSVFGICDTVKLYSAPDHFREKIKDVVPFSVEILDFTRPEDIPYEDVDSIYTTRFIFPYAVGESFSGFNSVKTLNEVLSQKLQNLGITTLLFMHNLELIEYKIETDTLSTEGQYLLEKKEINDHCSIVSAVGMSDSDKTSGETEEVISYLKFTRPIGSDSQRSVDIAFSVIEDDEGNYNCIKANDPYVSVYFPTETESKLDFIVQGPYRTTPNRSSIPAKDPDNIKLAVETATLLRDSIRELKKSGKFNMSFVKVLPLNEKSFKNFDLFKPLYSIVLSIFRNEVIIPRKDGGYVAAKCAKIARQERLATLLPDEMLTSLIGDGSKYYWLPTFLTETNREFEQVYRFLVGELKIGVIRPEDLRIYFNSNPTFLPNRSDEWLIQLYSLLENIGAAFSKSKNETNMLTAAIVKTSKGSFVAPYRKTDDKRYIPNVFLPSEKIASDDINIVDKKIYNNCKPFFCDILQLQKPNEYELFVKDFKRRYEKWYELDEEKHIEDLKTLLKYLRYDEFKTEIETLIKGSLVLRCNDGQMRNPSYVHMYQAITTDGINIEGYYRNIANNVFYVDTEYYSLSGISIEQLHLLGVRDSILTGETITQGVYDNGTGGRKPEWWTLGEFKWKLSVDKAREAIKYISDHSTAKDSILKSQVLLRILFNNEAMLVGDVHIGGSTQDLHDETCELVKILRGERTRGWDGKWLFTEAGELVSPKNISKHEISGAIYGKVKPDSDVYEILGFKKTEADEVENLKKTIPQKQLDAFFESELRQRFGITSIDLDEQFGSKATAQNHIENNEIYSFPVVRVKNWETLKKHAAEMLCFADPVAYDYAVRRVRISNRKREAKAYLHNMYRYDGVYKYACQMCHEACSSVEYAQMFNNPKVELDPMNLNMCPNCAEKYRKMRSNEALMEKFRRAILGINEEYVASGEQVIIPLGNEEIWFAQTHFAEIQELLKLEEDIKNEPKTQPKKDTPVNEEPEADKNVDEKAGLSVYSGYIGKIISRKKDGFLGEVIDVDDQYVYVNVVEGKNAGQNTKIQLKFILEKNDVYEIL